jgi:hypothetical protein
MLIIAVGVLLAGLGTTASIILNRLPTTVAPAAPRNANLVLAAAEAFDWDRYHDRQDACLEADRIAAACTQGHCDDDLALRQAQRACSLFSAPAERH